MNVLYYTNVQIHEIGNGGNICCRNHIRRLSQEKDLKVFAVVTQEPRCEPGTKAFLDSLGIPFRFAPYAPVKKPKSIFQRVHRSLQGRLRAPAGLWRKLSLTPTRVQELLDEMIAEWKIEALVIDHYASAMHIELPRFDIKTCIIKLNREADFYSDQVKYGEHSGFRLAQRIDIWRLRRLENKIDSAVGKVIVIGAPDLPRGKTQSPPVCITPYLDRKPVQWTHTQSRSIFFVGNINHYPNRLAIEWTAVRLAPKLARICPGAVIKIVGCKPEDVPPAWRQANVEYLGFLDREGVERLFCQSELMLCPIENDFGMKFKSAEAVAFGTPLLASVQTLLGLPYLKNQPAIDLGRPEDAAILIGELISNEGGLRELSASQTRAYEAFVKTQKSIWTTTLKDIPVMSPHS